MRRERAEKRGGAAMVETDRGSKGIRQVEKKGRAKEGNEKTKQQAERNI